MAPVGPEADESRGLDHVHDRATFEAESAGEGEPTTSSLVGSNIQAGDTVSSADKLERYSNWEDIPATSLAVFVRGGMSWYGST